MQFEYAKLTYEADTTKAPQWNLDYGLEISHSDETNLLLALNKFGLEGWEVVGNLPAPDQGLILKRAKTLFPSEPGDLGTP